MRDCASTHDRRAGSIAERCEGIEVVANEDDAVLSHIVSDQSTKPIVESVGAILNVMAMTTRLNRQKQGQ